MVWKVTGSFYFYICATLRGKYLYPSSFKNGEAHKALGFVKCSILGPKFRIRLILSQPESHKLQLLEIRPCFPCREKQKIVVDDLLLLAALEGSHCK